MAKSNEKKPLKSCDLDIKLRAIEAVNRGMGITDVAKELNVHVVTVRRWMKSEEKLRKWEQDHENVSLAGKKRIRLLTHPMVDHATWIWFTQHRRAGLPITGPIIMTQALNFSKLFGGTTEFKASSGWLSKWKVRHEITNVTLCGEILPSDEAGAEVYKNKFTKMIEDERLTPQQVFNCDEMGLNIRQTPRTSLNCVRATAAAGFKDQKERLTVMACCNASGTLKLPLMVIGKYAKPRAIKNLKTLPVFYKNQTSAWMSAFLFKEWFKGQFVPAVETFLKSQGLPPKAILFMKNCSAQPNDLAVNGIRVEFLPPNTTSLIQPMDQGCLQNIKSLYKMQLMTFIMDQFNTGATIPQALKNVTVREVIFWLAEAWDKVAPTTISKTWKKLWPNIMEIIGSVYPIGAGTNVFHTAEHQTLINNFHQCLQNQEDYMGIQLEQVNEWIDSSPLLMREECLTDEEIVQVISEQNGEKTEESSKDGKENKTRNVIESQEIAKELSEAEDNLKKVIGFCEKHPHYTKGHLLGLYQVRDAMESQLIIPNPHCNKSPLK